jgi:preprotein translocase subunit SecY
MAGFFTGNMPKEIADNLNKMGARIPNVKLRNSR